MNEVQPGKACLHIEFQEQRSRLSLLQPLLGLPQLLLIAVASIPVAFLDIAAWFTLVFTGRPLVAHHRWVSLFLVASIRVWAYVTLVVDTYPGWRLERDRPSSVLLVIGPETSYRRDATALRFTNVGRAWLGGLSGALGGYGLLVISSVRLLATGRQNRRLFDLQCECLRRFSLFGLVANLVIEDYELPLV
jgi:hypothetical protein